ncbi:MAG TPA: hypothetical protein DIU39_01295 [Flavobacteriales bacterium]|nr:hypothetical protein [Flavobacteriales bacterium]|tara:strand:+ start:105 stop:638 length:534 start_codon:yes stop_codon:yes gene_type:complete
MKNINISKNKDRITIEIYPKYNKQKHIMMLFWLALWTVCGLAILTQLFGDYDIKTKFFFVLYLLFWLFFEYKVIYTHRWRKYGKEIIKIIGDKVHLVKEIKGRGVEQIFDKNDIEKIEIFNEKENSMSQLFGNAYWMISGYQLAFKTKDKLIPFGLELDEKEKKKIVFELNRSLKQN